jgi:hypothetical protein
MNIGSLNETITRSRDLYLESVRLEPDDMVCILGQTALHHTLQEHDAMYLWEFAALNEKTVTVTFSAKDMDNGIRGDIDNYHKAASTVKDEKSFEANKKTLSDRIDNNINLLKGSSNEKEFQGEIDRLESFKKRIQSEQYPKSWLAKKIQWFRNLYAKFMHKNTASPQPGVTGFIKRILATIARIIDMLMKKLQNAVN